jgi:hypothetical protein
VTSDLPCEDQEHRHSEEHRVGARGASEHEVEVQDCAEEGSDTVRSAVKSSGREETSSNAAAALVGSVTEQVKQAIDRNVPGFSQKMESAKQTQGSVMDKAKAQQQ